MKKTLFDIIESYYAAHMLIHLNNRGVFKDPGKSRMVKNYFPNADVFRFLSTRTDILQPGNNGAFSINKKYGSYINSGFHIEKFLQAYGQFDAMSIVIDERKFAETYQHATPFSNPGAVLNIFSLLQAQTILDLGCGTGNTMVQFCRQNKLNRAFGIDQNPHLNKAAKQLIKRNSLSARAKVVNGSVTEFDKLLHRAALEQVDVVYGASIFNEFFYSPRKLVALLRKLVKAFRGKFLVVVDYYGSFNSQQKNNRDLHHNYVHDVMQILTGQGVPPKDHKAWNEYYKKANATLLQIQEGSGDGINWFIHIVKLGNK